MTIQIVSGGFAKVKTWGGLTNGQTGEAIEENLWADRSIQVTGVFGAGGSLTVQGSNDGTNWSTLTDPQGNDLIFTTSKIETVIEICRYIRPVVTGDGSTNLTATLFMRGNL